MTNAEWDFASALLFLEDQVADLREMLRAQTPGDLGSVQNRRSLSRLRGAAVDLAALYLTASAIAGDQLAKESK